MSPSLACVSVSFLLVPPGPLHYAQAFYTNNIHYRTLGYFISVFLFITFLIPVGTFVVKVVTISLLIIHGLEQFKK